MKCENRGCPYMALWRCRTADGKVKHICQGCYLKEGYDKLPARADASLISEEGPMEAPEIRRKIGNRWYWQYTEEAATKMSELHLRHGKWKAVAALLGVTEGSLSVYASQLRKKGYTVGAERSTERSTEAEPVRNREVGAVEKTLETDHDVELVQLQRRRIAALEEALREARAIISKALDAP